MLSGGDDFHNKISVSVDAQYDLEVGLRGLASGSSE
jgi:hypothetical protein